MEEVEDAVEVENEIRRRYFRGRKSKEDAGGRNERKKIDTFEVEDDIRRRRCRVRR